VAKAGPRKIANYGDRFKATAVKLSSLPGVQIKDAAKARLAPGRMLTRHQADPGSELPLEGAVNASRKVTLSDKCPSSIASKSSWFTSGFGLGSWSPLRLLWSAGLSLRPSAQMQRFGLWAHLAPSR